MNEQLYNDILAILKYYTRLDCLCEKKGPCLPCRAKSSVPALKLALEEHARYREVLEDIGACSPDQMDRTMAFNALHPRREG